MATFNTPVIKTIKGVEQSFPRLLLADLETLTTVIVARRKQKIQQVFKTTGYAQADLPRVLLNAELEDFDIFQACVGFSRTGPGARKIIETSWLKTPGRTTVELWQLLADENPNLILDLAYEVLSAPKEDVKDPTPAGQDPAALPEEPVV